jgi:Fe-S-cluster containining protein
MCRDCNANCCTMPVEVKAEDLLRLGLIGEDEVRASPKKVFNRLAKQGILKSFRASTGLFMLVQKSNDDCIFLGPDRLCTVYDKRPGVCREFPSIGPRPGFCPKNKKSLSR